MVLMGASKEEGYRVEMKQKETVAAILPLQEHWLPLSNLDLLLPPLDVGVFFCYKRHKQQPSDMAAMVSILKASLRKTLVTYYPLAGEVVTNSVGEPELLCNNRGVDFVVAYADVELGELNIHNPDDSVEKKLMPEKKNGVLSVQVTELKCGGMVLACTFDHRIADAYSADMFLIAWTEMAVGGGGGGGAPNFKNPAIYAAPTFRKSLLIPRRPGHHDGSPDRLYVPLSSLKPNTEDHHNDINATINRIYYIAAADIEQMQEDASIGSNRRSKMEAFSAYLWQLIGKAAKKNRAAQVCRMGIVVNGRSRLKQHSEVMESYFGNVLTIPYGTLRLQNVEGMELSEPAGAVHDFLQGATTEEHFLGLIDWVEALRPNPAVARIYFNGAGDGEPEDGVSFVVSSGRGFPVTELEFGWGRPVFGSYHFPWGGSSGYVMPMPSAKGGGDWVVYVHLLKDLVEELEAEAGDVFHPLTAEYFMADPIKVNGNI